MKKTQIKKNEMKGILVFLIASASYATAYCQTADDYYNRGISKRKLQDYRGAMADFTKAIELNPNYADAYVNRGVSKLMLNQKDSGCLDLSKAGELGDEDAYDVIRQLCN